MPGVSELLQIGAQRPKAPKPDELELKFSQRAIDQLDSLKSHYPDLKSCVLPGLWIAQREYGGWLPPAAIAEVAHRLDRSYAEVEGVATFYSMYNTAHEPGRHVIEVCTCLSCHMCGAYRIVDALEAKLGIKLGGTTSDGMFTVHEVECLDACDRAPVLQIGDEYVGPVTPDSLDALLVNLRNTETPSSVKLADSVVAVHLKDGKY